MPDVDDGDGRSDAADERGEALAKEIGLGSMRSKDKSAAKTREKKSK